MVKFDWTLVPHTLIVLGLLAGAIVNITLYKEEAPQIWYYILFALLGFEMDSKYAKGIRRYFKTGPVSDSQEVNQDDISSE